MFIFGIISIIIIISVMILGTIFDVLNDEFLILEKIKKYFYDYKHLKGIDWLKKFDSKLVKDEIINIDGYKYNVKEK